MTLNSWRVALPERFVLVLTPKPNRPDKTVLRFTYWILSRVQRSRPAQYGHCGQDFPSG
jgi:hypothetical protein